jgi:hypothetical protein
MGKVDKNFLTLLEGISKRPAMYVGDISIRDVSNYLTGYAMGRDDAGRPVFAVSWQSWIETKFMISHSAWHWSRILLHKHGNDADAISALPELYKEYVKDCPADPDELEAIHRKKFMAQYGKDYYSPKTTETQDPVASPNGNAIDPG